MSRSTNLNSNSISVRVIVIPQARKESFKELKSGVFEIRVREPAARNEANERVCTLVARHFGVTRSSVSITAGHHGGKKRISVTL